MINFTSKWSSKSLMFLDMRVILDGDKLVTDLDMKPKDTHQYLHQSTCSWHPSYCKNSIAHSQPLRIRRVCSRHMDYVCHAEELKGHLVRRGLFSWFLSWMRMDIFKRGNRHFVIFLSNDSNYPHNEKSNSTIMIIIESMLDNQAFRHRCLYLCLKTATELQSTE